ncbi:hypothetical protein Mapa_015348 [Marchantia paleacea]|nr:hypothetical protein Mapa_015348 [Marchantia paleacea]
MGTQLAFELCTFGIPTATTGLDDPGAPPPLLCSTALLFDSAGMGSFWLVLLLAERGSPRPERGRGGHSTVGDKLSTFSRAVEAAFPRLELLASF